MPLKFGVFEVTRINWRGGDWTWAAFPMASLHASKTEWCPCFLHAQLCAASPQLVSCQLWSGGSVTNRSLPDGADCKSVCECSFPHACLISVRNWCQGDCLWCWDEEPRFQVWMHDSACDCFPLSCCFLLFICKALFPHPLHPRLSVCRENRQNWHVKVPSEPIYSNWKRSSCIHLQMPIHRELPLKLSVGECFKEVAKAEKEPVLK